MFLTKRAKYSKHKKTKTESWAFCLDFEAVVEDPVQKEPVCIRIIADANYLKQKKTVVTMLSTVWAYNPPLTFEFVFDLTWK